jgi:hypothetical protein
LVKGELIKEELNFSGLVDILAYPAEFLVLTDFIIISPSLLDTNILLILGRES